MRAVCYQLFNAKLIPDMSKASTNKVSRALTLARQRGVIPWEWVVDETREAERIAAWGNPAAYARAVARSYRRDRWEHQPQRIEVWSEKGTVRGTLAPILHEYGVTFRVMHGYSSATALWEAAEDAKALDAPLHVFYVGDYDPSGMHMSAVDLPRRLGEHDAPIHIERVALTRDDIERGDLPGFAALEKRRDPRYRWFVGTYGPRCWELDALDPVRLRERVRQAILRHLDLAAWERVGVVEGAELASLREVLADWHSLT